MGDDLQSLRYRLVLPSLSSITSDIQLELDYAGMKRAFTLVGIHNDKSFLSTSCSETLLQWPAFLSKCVGVI